MTGTSVPPPPNGKEPPRWARDDKADNEDKNFANEEELRGQNHQNTLEWLKIYGKIITWGSVGFSIIFFATALVWIIHYTLPPCWLWLNPEQLSKIQSVLFSGSMGAIISGIVQKQLSKSN